MRGLTLIETLIYLALFSTLMSGVLISLISIQGGAGRIEVGSRLTDEGHFILERLRFEIERSTAISVDGPTRLTAITADGPISLYLLGNSLMEESSTEIEPLSEPNSVVDNLVFAMDSDERLSVLFSLQISTQEGTVLSALFSDTFFLLNQP